MLATHNGFITRTRHSPQTNRSIAPEQLTRKRVRLGMCVSTRLTCTITVVCTSTKLRPVTRAAAEIDRNATTALYRSYCTAHAKWSAGPFKRTKTENFPNYRAVLTEMLKHRRPSTEKSPERSVSIGNRGLSKAGRRGEAAVPGAKGDVAQNILLTKNIL